MKRGPVCRLRSDLYFGGRVDLKIYEVGQVTLFRDEATEKRARVAAHAPGISFKRWAAARIVQRTQPQWSPQVRALAGAWPDFPAAEELRTTGRRDLRRNRL